jgi:hypothetical protein
MALFLRLMLGHLLGDFAFQPGRLVKAKRAGFPGQALHGAVVTACTALVLADVLAFAWPAVALAGAAHLAIEYISVPARSDGTRSGLVVFVLDQALHVISLVLISLALPAAVPPGVAGLQLSMVQLAFVDGIVAVALMGSILAFEVRASVHEGGDRAEGTLLPFDGARAYGMFERSAALIVAAVSPIPVVGYAAFAPRAAFALSLPPAAKARHLSETAVGAALCTVVWLLVAAVAIAS